jgi:hypothetical protein
MAREVKCETHGSGEEAFVCHHLVGDAVGRGFNRVSEPSAADPSPDAWCDDCETIRAARDGWDEESEKLTKIVLLCSGCYERARIRNTRTPVTLDDLSGLRWKCSSCEEWHYGPVLDLTYDAPYYWNNEYERTSLPGIAQKTFLNEDYCQIDDDYFVRGLIRLPIIGTDQCFSWGVWGSLSKNSFDLLIEKDGDPASVELPAMFSWLSTQISGYPDTLSLRMFARIPKPGWRPHFELEPSDHPLSREYHEGITPERVKEITLRRVDASEG